MPEKCAIVSTGAAIAYFREIERTIINNYRRQAGH